MSNPGYYHYYYPPPPPQSTQYYYSQQQVSYSTSSTNQQTTTEKPHPPTDPDDMELDSPSNESVPEQHPNSQNQNQYNQPTYQQGQIQYNQSGQNQSYQQGYNQYNHSYQNQYEHSYQQGQNWYDHSYQQGQNHYDQSCQQGQNQYDQSYQQGQNQCEQSYQQGQNHYDQSCQQGQNQYNQSYQQGQNQCEQSTYQSLYYPTQYFTSNYYSPAMPGGYYQQWNGQWGQWQSTYSTVGSSETVRGGEWPQWGGQRRRGRGRGIRQVVGKYSSVPPPTVINKSNVTTTQSNTTSSSQATAFTTTSSNTTTSTSTTASSNTENKTSMTSSDWPPGLQDYMVRSFASCQSEEEKTQVEQYLKVEINEMFRDKRVWQIDWSIEPLPLEKLKRQAQKRKSRWDTPSPSVSAVLTIGEKSTPPPSTEVSTVPLTGFGKKKKSKRGKGKFFIDRTGGANLSEEDKVRVDQRSVRFAKGVDGNRKFKPKLSIEELLKTVSVEETDSFCMEGTSLQLEKRYLRLTTAPDPSTIRPESVLKQSLSFVLEKSKEYNYICEQLKSIRQDLTIQGIRNTFTVEVYETHGRIALKHGDWSEFNQCQSQLGSLYSEGLPGHKPEFIAYRILYHMMTNETADFIEVFKGITSEMVSDPAVAHAMKLRKAWSFGNYKRFFQLYKSTPNCGRHLVDLFIDRERKAALKVITKAYRPCLAIDYISAVLSFPTVSECRTFLIGCDTVFDDKQLKVDCRLTYNKLIAKTS